MKTKLEMAKKDYEVALEKLNSLEKMDAGKWIFTSCWGSPEERTALAELSKKRYEAHEELREKEMHYFTLEAEYEYRVNGNSEAVAQCADAREAFVKAEQAAQNARAEMFAAWQEGGGLLDAPGEKYAAAEKKFIEANDDWRDAQEKYVRAWKACKSRK